IADHALAARHLAPTRLELRFDEREQERSRAHDPSERWQELVDTDERRVHDHEIDGLVERARVEIARIGAIADDDARVFTELRCELVLTNVHRVHAARTALQEAIGESSRRGPHADADHSGGVEREAVERPFELVAAAGHVPLPLADPQRRRAAQELPRLLLPSAA